MKYLEEEYEVLFKGTDSQMQCRNFQFEMNKEFIIENNRPIQLCSNGFHACSKPESVNDFYKMFSFSKNRLFRIKGHVIQRDEYSYKVVCDSIIFVEEINFTELLNAIITKNYDHPYAKYYSESFFKNYQWKVTFLKEYEELQTFEEKVSYLLKHFWSTKYLTIKQMKLFVETLDSLEILYKFIFFLQGYGNSLVNLLDWQNFRELRKNLACAKKGYYHPNYSTSYNCWYEDNLKKNSRKKSKNS